MRFITINPSHHITTTKHQQVPDGDVGEEAEGKGEAYNDI